MVDDGEGSTSPRTPEVDTEPPLSSPRKSASTTPSEKKPNSMWKTWKELPVAEKIAYCAVALPALPLVIAFGPIIALHLMLEKDNAKFYRGSPPEQGDNSDYHPLPPPTCCTIERVTRPTFSLSLDFPPSHPRPVFSVSESMCKSSSLSSSSFSFFIFHIPIRRPGPDRTDSQDVGRVVRVSARKRAHGAFVRVAKTGRRGTQADADAKERVESRG